MSGLIGTARRRHPCRVFLVGYYGVGNLGDELIRHAIEREAEALGVEVFAYANWGHANDSDPRAVQIRGRGVLRYVRACLTADRVVLGGGGILKDEGSRMPLELLATALLARVFRRPVALLCVGVGPFYTRLGRAAIKAVARLCEYRSVRDEDSADALGRLGIRHVEVGADPVFCVAGDGGAGSSVPSSPDRSGRGRKLVVSVRPWFLSSSPDRWERFAQDLAAALCAASPRRLDIAFTAFYWPRDRIAAADVARHLNQPALVPDAPATLTTVLADVRAARLVVAMRYHSVLLAAASGCPTVAVAYEPKVVALAAQIGIASVSVDDPDLRIHLQDRITEALAQSAGEKPAVARLRDRARRCIARSLVGS